MTKDPTAGSRTHQQQNSSESTKARYVTRPLVVSGRCVMGWILDPERSPEEMAEVLGGGFTADIVREIRAGDAFLIGDTEQGLNLVRKAADR